MSDDNPFGYSLALVDGDIALTNSSNTIVEGGVTKPLKTLQLVSGNANLLQALTLRVQTPSGSDIFNITYGLDIKDAFVLPNTTRMIKEFIKLSLVKTLATDPRVQDVREFLFMDDPQYLKRHPETSEEKIQALRSTRTWLVDVVIDTVDAQTEALSLNLGVLYG